MIYAISAVAPAYFEDGLTSEGLKTKIEIKQSQLHELEISRNRLVEAIRLSSTSIAQLVGELGKVGDEIKFLETEINQLKTDLRDFISDPDEVFKKISSLISLKDNIDARAELRENISRVVETIVVNEVMGFVSLHMRGESIVVNHPMRRDGLVMDGIKFYSE